MTTTNHISRRDFMRITGRLAGGALAATKLATIIGCGDGQEPNTPPASGPSIIPESAQPPTLMSIVNNGPDKYDLAFTNREGIFTEKVPLLQNIDGALQTGTGGYRLTSLEGQGTIVTGDYFVLNKPGTDFTHVLQYVGYSWSSKTLHFYDLGTQASKDVVWDPLTLQADLVAGGETYKIFVSDQPSDAIKVDLNGDGAVTNGAQSLIVNQHGGRLYLDNSPNTSPSSQDPSAFVALALIIPKDKFGGSLDELVEIKVTKAGPAIDLEVPDQGNITMAYDQSSGLFVGKTKHYGAKFELDKSVVPAKLNIWYPDQAVMQ